jgi:hypothetical protein
MIIGLDDHPSAWSRRQPKNLPDSDASSPGSRMVDSRWLE